MNWFLLFRVEFNSLGYRIFMKNSNAYISWSHLCIKLIEIKYQTVKYALGPVRFSPFMSIMEMQ